MLVACLNFKQTAKVFSKVDGCTISCSDQQYVSDPVSQTSYQHLVLLLLLFSYWDRFVAIFRCGFNLRLLNG